jgi:hypothetical protein
MAVAAAQAMTGARTPGAPVVAAAMSSRTAIPIAVPS